MSTETVYSAVRAYLEGSFQSVPLAFENERFARPTDQRGKVLPFVLVEITGRSYAQASIGAGLTGNLWREEGRVWAHVFVAVNSGSLAARTIAHQIADLFKGLALNGGALLFFDASIGLGAPGDDDGVYWRLSVSIDFKASF